jgi:hypothetical protein
MQDKTQKPQRNDRWIVAWLGGVPHDEWLLVVLQLAFVFAGASDLK